MSTKVQLPATGVINLARLGVSTIKAERLVKLDDWLEEAMQERKPKFLLSIFGTKPRYESRAAAMEACKTPYEYSVSPYLRITRYYKHAEERQLTRLAEMARNSIDDTIWLGFEDFTLLRKYML